MIKQEKIDEYKARAKALVAQMTLEEKVFQLRHYAPAIERLGIKAYNYWNEALHGVARAGVATVFPQAIGLAASFDEELVGKVAEAISTEGRGKFNAQDKYGDHGIYKGLTFWAPNINIFRDPRWGRGHETYGEDPYLTSRLGVSFVKGIQGDDENYLKAAACAKHFAVHSGPESIRHSFNAEVGKQDMRETYLPAFEALVKEAKVEAVMGAYNRTNGEACCGSKTLLKDILRDEWGFDGHVTSDCWAIKDINENHKITNSPEESVALAMNSGCDLNCGDIYAYLLKAVEDGLTTEEAIDTALTRALTTRMKLGLFDAPEANKYASIDYSFVDSDENRALNLKASKESIVLLKNKDNILPLNKSKKTIGIIGPNANNRRALVGNYEGTSSNYITVLDGIRRELEDSDCRIFYSEGCHLFKDKTEGLGEYNDRIAEVKAVCEQSDILIACLGLDAGLEGEEGDTGNSYASGDKTDLKLPGLQQNVLETMVESGKPVILVMLAGSAMALDYADKNVNAVIQGWYPGAMGGKAIAEVIFGKANPCGKLPVTFYSENNSLPEFTDYSMKNRTYRYMKETPVYPFGYGLSYSSFTETLAGIEVNGTAASSDREIEINADSEVGLFVNVRNSGSVAGAATVQVYVKYMGEGENIPNYQLKGLKKVFLDKSAEQSVKIELSSKAFSLYNENGELELNKGKYEVYISDGQPDERTVELTGNKVISLRFAVK